MTVYSSFQVHLLKYLLFSSFSFFSNLALSDTSIFIIEATYSKSLHNTLSHTGEKFYNNKGNVKHMVKSILDNFRKFSFCVFGFMPSVFLPGQEKKRGCRNRNRSLGSLQISKDSKARTNVSWNKPKRAMKVKCSSSTDMSFIISVSSSNAKWIYRNLLFVAKSRFLTYSRIQFF